MLTYPMLHKETSSALLKERMPQLSVIEDKCDHCLAYKNRNVHKKYHKLPKKQTKYFFGNMYAVSNLTQLIRLT